MLSRQFRILVVEDDDGHASLVRRNLIRSGVANEIMRARNGREALELIRTQLRSPKRESNISLLMLLDLNMPVIDGLGVLDTVKANRDTAEIPVIMLTTTDDPREIERCYAAGCSLYISKPVEYEKFVEVIGRLGGFLQVISVPTGLPGSPVATATRTGQPESN